MVTSYYRRVYLSVAAAAIYMASQASQVKKTQKGMLTIFFILLVLVALYHWQEDSYGMYLIEFLVVY